MAAEKTTMKVNIVAADHPVWHGEATSVTIPASEGGMGILPDHEPVLTVIKQGTLTVVEPDGDRHMFEVTDGFISFDSNKLTVAAGRGMRYALYVQGVDQLKEPPSDLNQLLKGLSGFPESPFCYVCHVLRYSGGLCELLLPTVRPSIRAASTPHCPWPSAYC